jgi:hypothetical protein
MPALALLFLQSQQDFARAQAMIPAILIGGLVVMAVCMAIIVLPFWFICKKAGLSPWLSLLWFIPMGGLILCYVLAFSDWRVVPAPQVAYTPPLPPYPPQA